MESQEPKRKLGKPKKITPHIARKIFFCFAKGLTNAEVGEVFGVSEDTLVELKKEADYSDPIKKFKEEADLRVVNCLYQRAIGYYPEDKAFNNDGEIKVVQLMNHAPDTNACALWLMNRQRETWRKEIQHEENKPKPVVIRLFSKVHETEVSVVSRGDNQVDVLLGKDFTEDVKKTSVQPESNGKHPHK